MLAIFILLLSACAPTPTVAPTATSPAIAAVPTLAPTATASVLPTETVTPMSVATPTIIPSPVSPPTPGTGAVIRVVGGKSDGMLVKLNETQAKTGELPGLGRIQWDSATNQYVIVGFTPTPTFTSAPTSTPAPTPTLQPSVQRTDWGKQGYVKKANGDLDPLFTGNGFGDKDLPLNRVSYQQWQGGYFLAGQQVWLPKENNLLTAKSITMGTFYIRIDNNGKYFLENNSRERIQNVSVNELTKLDMFTSVLDWANGSGRKTNSGNIKDYVDGKARIMYDQDGLLIYVQAAQ